MRAVKLCTNKILHFLTGGAVANVVDLYIGYQTVNHIAYLNEITEVLDVNKLR